MSSLTLYFIIKLYIFEQYIKKSTYVPYAPNETHTLSLVPLFWLAGLSPSPSKRGAADLPASSTPPPSSPLLWRATTAARTSLPTAW